MDKIDEKITHPSTDDADNGSMSGLNTTVMGTRARREHGKLAVGDVVLKRYELQEELGSGAMGVVFKCMDRVSHAEYALKMVPPELSSSADAMEGIRANFQLVLGLNHPNIAGIYFLERDEYGAYFLVMEYVRGTTLSKWIIRKQAAGQPDLNEVAGIVAQIAAALDFAHKKRILHRDIKPANVMLDENGEVKVLDFGLASKVRNTLTAMSIATSSSNGTPNYLSPEQFKGRYPTPASDQYALAVMTYEMLAGHLPFESPDVSVLREAVLKGTAKTVDGIPKYAQTALTRGMSKDPSDRFDSCVDFADILEGKHVLSRKNKTAIEDVLAEKKVIHKWALILVPLAVFALVFLWLFFHVNVGSSDAPSGSLWTESEMESELETLIVPEQPAVSVLKMSRIPGVSESRASENSN